MNDPAADERAEARLAAARARLILDKPFLGALVLRLPLVPAGAWCRTTGTDARRLFYNPQWIASLTAAEVQFALAHEALHCALGHFARRGHRVRRLWDLACDFAINPLLIEEGLTPPPGAEVLALYRGMAAEEIYPCLDDTLDQETLDDHFWDGDDGGQDAPAGSGQADRGNAGARADASEIGEPTRRGSATDAGAGDPADAAEAAEAAGQAPTSLSARDRESLQRQWERHLAGAAQRAREAGKLSGTLARLVEAALAPQVSWRAALAQHLSQTARDDYSWQRPSRRTGEASGDVIWPSLHSRSGEIFVALDTSGSIADEDLRQFLGELNAIKGALPVRITLLACDAGLAPDAPWVCEAWQELRLPRAFEGGGGTAFAPVFDWIDSAGAHPDALVYFTDGDGEFPLLPPNYPVLWLIKGRRPVPWGRRIQLN